MCVTVTVRPDKYQYTRLRFNSRDTCYSEGKNVSINTSTSTSLSFHFAWENIFRDQTIIFYAKQHHAKWLWRAWCVVLDAVMVWHSSPQIFVIFTQDSQAHWVSMLSYSEGSDCLLFATEIKAWYQSSHLTVTERTVPYFYTFSSTPLEQLHQEKRGQHYRIQTRAQLWCAVNYSYKELF